MEKHALSVRSATLADLPTIVDFNCRLAWETEHKRLDLETITRGVRRALTQPVKQMPAHSVVFAIDGREQSVAVTPESLGATLDVELTRGRHRLQGWLRGQDGTDLCGAYYAQFTRA